MSSIVDGPSVLTSLKWIMWVFHVDPLATRQCSDPKVRHLGSFRSTEWPLLSPCMYHPHCIRQCDLTTTWTCLRVSTHYPDHLKWEYYYQVHRYWQGNGRFLVWYLFWNQVTHTSRKSRFHQNEWFISYLCLLQKEWLQIKYIIFP